MQVQNRISSPSIRSQVHLSQVSSEASPEVEGDRYTPTGALWQDVDVQPVKLPDSPPPALPRPVIFLHGFNGSADRWGHVFEWLTSGDEPANKSGGIVDAGEFSDIDPEANLFSLRLSRPYNSVEKNKAELKAAVEAIADATGHDEVDLVVHSLGGLNARAYLQDADERVNKMVQLGTPNHGSQLANLERFFREKFDYPVIPPVDDPEVRRVLEQLSVDTTKRNGEPNNPWLRALNDDWSEQREKADVLIVAGAGVPTVTAGPGLTIFGDGVVTRRSAKLSGVDRKTSWFRTHGGLQNSGKVMETTANFLAGHQLAESENLFDRPEDVLKAAELVAPKDNSRSGEVDKAGLEEVERASKLPILDPAFQMGLSLGIISAMMGGPKETLPLVQIGVNHESGDNSVEASYDIDMALPKNQLKGSGKVDGDDFAEVADFNEGKVHWSSAIGLLGSGLTMEVGEDEKSITMQGNLAGVPTDLQLDMKFNDDGKMSGIHTHGKFNGEDYNVRSTIDMGTLLGDQQGDGQTKHEGQMMVSGVVNGDDMERSYRVDVKKQDGNLEFNARAGGQQPQGQAIGVSVKVIER